jgi:[protein-PII] uridylyltransferase
MRPPETLEIAEQLKRSRSELLSRFGELGGFALSHRLADLVDQVIRRIYSVACAGAKATPDDDLPLAILATGGYGRRDLAPFSDVDVTFVLQEEGDPVLDAVVRRMFLLLMDVFTVAGGLTVGYAYRLVEDCEGLEHETQTALLDARRVAGSEPLAHSFSAELARTLEPGLFCTHKWRERERAWKEAGTVFLTEPNLKEGPGGLRDLHCAGWMARARYDIQRRDVWTELRGLRVLTHTEVDDLRVAHEALLRTRHALHLQAGRQMDHLVAERQEAVAAALGYGTLDQPDLDAFHTQLYSSARTIHALSKKVIDHCLAGPLALSNRLVLCDGALHPTDRHLFVDSPSVMVAVFHNAQEYGFRLSPELRDSLIDVADGRVGEWDEETFRTLFLSVLAGKTRVGPTLRLMSECEILRKGLPEFGPLLSTSSLNLAHRYTVGEHTLRAVEILDSLRRSDATDTMDLRRILSEVERPEILFLATLLHDAGKASRADDHSEVGAKMAAEVARRLRLDDSAVDNVAFLVRNHLLMSETVQLRDMHQEQTLRDFVGVVTDREKLRMLYLVTYADMNATGPGIWTSLQARFLEELYYRAEQALTQGLPEEQPEARIEGFQRRMKRELSLRNLSSEQVEEHTDRMSATYLLNTPMEQMAFHIRLVQRLKEQGPVVEFTDERGSDFTVMTLCTYDDPEPGLLHKIAGVLLANDLEVHAAQVFTGSDQPQIVLDTLWVGAHGAPLPLSRRRELEADLLSVLQGQVSVPELLKRRGRRLSRASMPREIRLHDDLSDLHTVVEVRGLDERGLLYRATGAMSSLGWGIHSARITTIGGEARDAFYVTDRSGGKVSCGPEVLREAINAEMSAA